MMLKVSDFKDYLKAQFVGKKIYNGTINKSENQCIGVYARGNGVPHVAIGGTENTSFSELPITILVHWTEDTNLCETMAIEIYEKLYGTTKILMGNVKIAYINMLDPCPINIDRDSKNIAEMVIRINIIYER